MSKSTPATDQEQGRSASSTAVSPPPCLHIHLFGRLTLAWGPKALPPLQSALARSLLSYLIIQRGRPIPRDVLIGSLWPECTDAVARKRLSDALWQIRRYLGAALDRLETDRYTVAFRPQAGDWIDVIAFARHLRRCKDLRTDGMMLAADLSACLAELSVAVDLYRADFLEDCYDDWALLERECLREDHLWAMEQLISLHKQWGDYEQALTYAQRLAAADPLRESAHCELMRLYHLLGRGRAALEQYTTLCQLLQDELGAEPAAATTALYHELVAITAEPGPVHLPMAPPPPTQADLSHLPFVGRVEERAILLEAAQESIRGRGGLILIEGSAGMGKTRLIEQVAAGARWRGMQVALGRALPDTAVPFHPLTGALRPLLTPLRISQLAGLVEPHHLGAIAPLLPEVATALPDLPSLVSLSPKDQRRRLWQGLAHCISTLGAFAPLLLILEDLHWADRATLEALEQILPALDRSCVLVVLTCRTGQARRRPAVWENLESLDRAYPMRRVTLSTLSLSETKALARRALTGGSVDDDLARWLWQETGGNPLLLIETIKALLDQETPLSDEQDWQPTAGELSLPVQTSIEKLVRRRLQRLRPSLRPILEAIAVLGEEADFATLARTTTIAPPDLIAPLGELEQLGFLQQTERAYCFEHDLVREGIYRAITPTQRCILHRRAGKALESTRPECVEALVHHFDRGKMPNKAMTYALQSAGRAQAVYDYQTALAYYEQALALTGDDPAVRWDILEQQEQALAMLGHRETQDQVLEEMLSLAGRLDDPIRRARARHRQGWREVLAGEPVRALVLLDEAAGLARAATQRDLLGECLTSIATARFRTGDITRCQAAAEEAGAIFQETGNLAGKSRILNLLGSLHLALTGNYSRALACYREGWGIEQELDNHYREAIYQINLGIVYSLLGEYQHAQEVLAKAARMMTHIGDHNRQAIICCWQGINYWGLGDLTRAEVKVQEALPIFHQVGDRNSEITALRWLGLIMLDRYDPLQARPHLEQGMAIALAHQQRSDWIICRALLALTCLHLGHLEEALRLSAEAMAALEELGEEHTCAKQVYFRRYQVVAVAEGLPVAQPHLERAFRKLMGEADRIENPTLRQSFLERVALHRAIVTARATGQPPPIRTRVRLAAASAPTGRPLHDDEFVELHWTVFASEDSAIGDPLEARRQRLLRLLREAADQEAAPTVSDLAEILDVHPRTVKRDLAALRAGGHTVPTRGQREIPSHSDS